MTQHSDNAFCIFIQAPDALSKNVQFTKVTAIFKRKQTSTTLVRKSITGLRPIALMDIKHFICHSYYRGLCRSRCSSKRWPENRNNVHSWLDCDIHMWPRVYNQWSRLVNLYRWLMGYWCTFLSWYVWVPTICTLMKNKNIYGSIYTLRSMWKWLISKQNSTWITGTNNSAFYLLYLQ